MTKGEEKTGGLMDEEAYFDVKACIQVDYKQIQNRTWIWKTKLKAVKKHVNDNLDKAENKDSITR